MIRSIYTAAANMVAQIHRQTVIANNIANVDTPGYKQDLTVEELFSNLLLRDMNNSSGGDMGAVGTGVFVPQMVVDRAQGDLVASDRSGDLGLLGPGFFSIQTADGVRYTRAGIFGRDATGVLVTPDGGQVLGQAGPVRIPPGAEMRITTDGRVFAGEQEIDRLRVVEFPDTAALEKVGNNYLVPKEGEPVAATQTTVQQGFYEQSNVDVFRAMSEMMAAMRAYQASQQVIQLQDQTLERAANDVGRLA